MEAKPRLVKITEDEVNAIFKDGPEDLAHPYLWVHQGPLGGFWAVR